MKKNIFHIKKYKEGFGAVEILISMVIMIFLGALVTNTFTNFSPNKTSNTASQNKTVQDFSYDTAWQGEFANLTQATAMILQNNNGVFTGLCQGANPNKCMKDLYSQNLSSTKNCDSQIAGTCWHNNGNWKDQKGNPISGTLDSAAGLMLLNGMLIAFVNVNTQCPAENCGQIYVDVNGMQQPNQMGQDIFIANINPNSISK